MGDSLPLTRSAAATLAADGARPLIFALTQPGALSPRDAYEATDGRCIFADRELVRSFEHFADRPDSQWASGLCGPPGCGSCPDKLCCLLQWAVHHSCRAGGSDRSEIWSEEAEHDEVAPWHVLHLGFGVLGTTSVCMLHSCTGAAQHRDPPAGRRPQLPAGRVPHSVRVPRHRTGRHHEPLDASTRRDDPRCSPGAQLPLLARLLRVSSKQGCKLLKTGSGCQGQSQGQVQGDL